MVKMSQNFVAFSEYMNFTTDGITPIHLTENDAIIFAMIKADDEKVLIACYLELLIRATIISMHLRSLFDFFFYFLDNCGVKER